MMKQIIENRAKEGEMTKCEKVLGDLSRVYRVADFWDVNADLIELIAANELLDYASVETFTPEEFAAFRRGLKTIGLFMSECAGERKKIEDLKIAGKAYTREPFQ